MAKVGILPYNLFSTSVSETFGCIIWHKIRPKEQGAPEITFLLCEAYEGLTEMKSSCEAAGHGWMPDIQWHPSMPRSGS
jgi:hypothetical protein